MPTVNERVVYRSIAGDEWDATVLRIYEGKEPRVDISVMGPGLKEPVEIYAIRWADDPAAPGMGARPRRIDTSDIPEVGEDWFATARRVDPEDDYADRAEWKGRR